MNNKNILKPIFEHVGNTPKELGVAVVILAGFGRAYLSKLFN